MNMARYCFSRSLLVVLVLGLSTVGFGQGGASAQLSGVVSDPGGATVPGASLTVRSTETGLTRKAQTSDTGSYTFGNLAPGVYEVAVSAQGFANSQTTVELTVGQHLTLNLTLPVTGVSEEVTITQTQIVESTKTELSQVIEERQIENLPISGRRFLDFVLLTPNVDTGRTKIGNLRFQGEPTQIDISFAGLSEIASLIRVDGAHNVSRIYGRSRAVPSQDAVREFRVVTGAYGADIGPAAGAVVNVITKSGTNDWHGSAYYFVRNNRLDAHNLLAAPGFDILKQNQYGGTIGGPIVRNRLFMFSNYEGQRRQESPFFSQILLANIDRINAVKQSFGLQPEDLSVLGRSNYDTFLLRGDYSISSANQLAVNYHYRSDRIENFAPIGANLAAPSNLANIPIRDYSLTANLASTLSTSIANQFLLNFSRRRTELQCNNFNPEIEVVNVLSTGCFAGPPDNPQETRFEISDALLLQRDTHTLNLGASVYHNRDTMFWDPFVPGRVSFDNLDAFFGRGAFTRPTARLMTFNVGPTGRERPPAPAGFSSLIDRERFSDLFTRRLNINHYAFFAQDQWRVTPKLVLNYGLRYDLDALPAPFKTYTKAFQPRIGIAYSPVERLVLRLSGGIYQGERNTNEYLGSLLLPAQGSTQGFAVIRNEYIPYPSTNAAVAAATVVGPTPDDIDRFLRLGVYPAPPPALGRYVNNFGATFLTKRRGIYAYQWNGQGEFQLLQDMALTLNYLGVRGLNLGSILPLNIRPSTFKLPNGENDYAAVPGGRQPALFSPLILASTNFFDDAGQSIYHALAATLSKRFSQHFSFTTNYTWSKAIDNSGGVQTVNFPEDPYRRDLERALSNHHVGHRFVGTFSAEAPETTFLRNFRFAFIATAESPRHYTVFAGSDVNHDGNSGTDRPGTLGRNTYQGDNYLNLDVRLSRTIHINKRIEAEFIAEAFNVFNKLNVTNMNTVYGAPDFIGQVPKRFGDGVKAPSTTFGLIQEIAPPRQIQFAFRLRF
jgi:hypothetical protein